MKPVTMWFALALLTGCRAQQPAPVRDTPVDGMTPEEHARMQAGQAAPAERQPIHLTAAQVRAIGVTFTVVERGSMARTVRTVGQVVPAEPGLTEVTARIDGYVEQLFVDATGVTVRRGQPLLALYSPMLVAGQEELLAALGLRARADSADAEAWRNAEALVQAARRRLAYWDVSPDQIATLERTGVVTKTVTLHAPFDGVVLDKMVVAGQSVMTGMKLYRLADLAVVWIEGAVFEQDMAVVRRGAAVRAELAAYPGRSFAGRVDFVWPTLDAESRTTRVRVAFPNRDGVLKPGMYATLLLDAMVDTAALHVPADAVVMTGERNLAFVVGPDGALEPRTIVLGARSGSRVQVLRGLMAGERIVAAANFLVDAESRLQTGAAMTAMPGMPERKP
jgi:Cu(I)/Ag(I) efflux system membrane fusion protein